MASGSPILSRKYVTLGIFIQKIWAPQFYVVLHLYLYSGSQTEQHLLDFDSMK